MQQQQQLHAFNDSEIRRPNFVQIFKIKDFLFRLRTIASLNLVLGCVSASYIFSEFPKIIHLITDFKILSPFFDFQKNLLSPSEPLLKMMGNL